MDLESIDMPLTGVATGPLIWAASIGRHRREAPPLLSHRLVKPPRVKRADFTALSTKQAGMLPNVVRGRRLEALYPWQPSCHCESLAGMEACY